MLTCVLALVAAQAVYSWRDASGQENFTNDLKSIPAKYRAKAKLVSEDDTQPTTPQGVERPAPIAAPPVVDEKPAPISADAELLKHMRQHNWYVDEMSRDAKWGPTFVQLSASSEEPVAYAAFQGMAEVYTAGDTRPEAATFEGVGHARIHPGDDFHAAVLKGLNHSSWRVRDAAARAAGVSIWGPQPNRAVLQAAAARYVVEDKVQVKEALGFSVWDSHTGDQALIDVALAEMADPNPRLQVAGVSHAARTGRSGRDFDDAQRQRLHTAVIPFLRSKYPVLRAHAVAAWFATRAAGEKPAAEVLALLRDDVGGVRARAAIELGLLHDLSMVPKILSLVDDTKPDEIPVQGEFIGSGSRLSVGQVALAALEEATGERLGVEGFHLEAKRGEALKPDALAREAARARAWYAAHRAALDALSPR